MPKEHLEQGNTIKWLLPESIELGFCESMGTDYRSDAPYGLCCFL
jgi:hypothetical protein